MDLIEVRGDDLLSQFVILCRHEGHTQTSQHSNEGLDNTVGVYPGVPIGRLSLAE